MDGLEGVQLCDGGGKVISYNEEAKLQLFDGGVYAGFVGSTPIHMPDASFCGPGVGDQITSPIREGITSQQIP